MGAHTSHSVSAVCRGRPRAGLRHRGKRGYSLADVYRERRYRLVNIQLPSIVAQNDARWFPAARTSVGAFSRHGRSCDNECRVGVTHSPSGWHSSRRSCLCHHVVGSHIPQTLSEQSHQITTGDGSPLVNRKYTTKVPVFLRPFENWRLPVRFASLQKQVGPIRAPLARCQRRISRLGYGACLVIATASAAVILPSLFTSYLNRSERLAVASPPAMRSTVAASVFVRTGTVAAALRARISMIE